MGKGTFFTGQPIFNQVLSFIPRSLVQSIARGQGADRYYKSFRTYDHLVTMLYAIFNRCNSLREVTTGLLAWERRIQHLGMQAHPRRSTLADANKSRNHEVFEAIYYKLLSRYRHLLPDSRRKTPKHNLYIFDSTSITLFQEILTGSGRPRLDGRQKGGIKVHTLLQAVADMPTMIRFSAATAPDVYFLKEVRLPKNSVIVFDRGYHDYSTYNRFSSQDITWVTRQRKSFIFSVKEEYAVNDYQKQKGVKSDRSIELGHTHHRTATKVAARMIDYQEQVSGKAFQFITNNFRLAPMTIANYYKQRWQIETFFKRIKQNYPLHYFLGDSENAIKIQIWCALIADLLLKVIKRGTRSTMAFSNLISLIRLHLMTYMDLKNFLRSPEKSLLEKIRQERKIRSAPSLFDP